MSLRVFPLGVDEVDVRKIHHSVFLLRDSTKGVEELSRSITEFGLLQPVILRASKNGFEVVAGNRRFEACKKLRWRKIPSCIIELSDKEAFEVALTENLERKTLDPLEEARAYQEYVKQAGWGGITELSGRIGRSVSYISKRMRLSSLDPNVLDEIFRRQKNVSLAEELLSLDLSEQHEISKTLETNNMSTRDVRSLVKAIRQAKVSEPEAGTQDSNGMWRKQTDRQKLVARCIDQTIIAMRLALSRLDGVLDRLETEWLEKEILMQYRFSLHTQIDSLIKLKMKMAASSRNLRGE